MAALVKQALRISQKLAMTPQLQQAIQMLQLSRLELLQSVQQELEENPLLEEELAELADADGDADGDGDGEAPDFEDEARDENESATQEAAEAELLASLDWQSGADRGLQTGAPTAAEGERPELEMISKQSPTLQEHLQGQLRFLSFSEEEARAMTWLLGSLNDDGYLEATLDELAERAGAKLAVMERMLALLQSLHPTGVAARDLSECLRLQLDARGLFDPLLRKLVDEELERLKRRDLRGIARDTGQSLEAVARAAKRIAELEPRPARGFGGEETIYITPDLYVHRVGDAFHVLLNEDGLPKLRLSQGYRRVLGDSQTKSDTQQYVRERMRAALWLIRSIYQRQRTIHKVMESIVQKQRAFFEQGIAQLRPLTLREVAEEIGMHESTVSRATTNKYVHTPQGLFELKYFFNPGIRSVCGDAASSESVRERIRRLVSQEDPAQPLSDQRIVELLRGENIAIARRTVAKYRGTLNILSSTKRRQVG